MLSATELSLQMKTTSAFIEHDAVDLIINRRSRIDDGEGGVVVGPESPVGMVRARLIPQSDKVPEVSTSDGRLLKPEFVLLCMPGQDMERYDVFSWHGGEWEIISIHEGPEYEMKGDVVHRG